LNQIDIESAKLRAQKVRSSMPPQGLFEGHTWRISPEPFALEPKFVKQLEKLGRVLLQFYRALNLLYRKSHEQAAPEWVADWLDAGKPKSLIQRGLGKTFKQSLPKVIRPDILLTEDGFVISELDSIPGGIGLTAWLNQTYSNLNVSDENKVIGGSDGMLEGFSGIFDQGTDVQIVVSEESKTYRPEMEWLASNINDRKIQVRDDQFKGFQKGDSVYRFFELFDLANVANAEEIFKQVEAGLIQLTPPPKSAIEEKASFALLHNRNLETFWTQHLGSGFFKTLREHIPYTWVIDPAPLPPQGAVPRLGLTNWHQLKNLSQKERNLILKVSGFSDQAWGARGVFLGSDLSGQDWGQVVDTAIRSFGRQNYIVQEYHKPKTVEARYHELTSDSIVPMKGRVRLCPYYFVTGEGDQARPHLGGVMATICPADKKIIHGMKDAIIAPCSA
jgi:hypothetical protein